MAKIVQLFLLLILTLFSSQSYSNALCPDGSKPIQTISADGSYYVPECAAAFKGVNSSISSISELPKCLSDPWHNCFGSFTYTDDNPMRYVGEWKNDKFNGIGTTYYHGEYTGDIYIGEHYDGWRHGVGIYYFKNKAYDAGVWKKGKLNGLSRIIRRYVR